MDNITRREALQKSGVVVGGVALGSVGLSGSATAKRGGSALTFDNEYKRKVPWQALYLQQNRDFPASCHADESAMKNYNVYQIKYETGKGPYALATRGEVEIGPYYVFNAQPTTCNEVTFGGRKVAKGSYSAYR